MGVAADEFEGCSGEPVPGSCVQEHSWMWRKEQRRWTAGAFEQQVTDEEV